MTDAEIALEARRSPSEGRSNAFLNWLLVRHELPQAAQAAAEFSRERAELLRRAKLALELGDMVLAQGSALRAGSASALTLDLFRQAAYWALRAQISDSEQVTPEAVWAAAESSLPGRTKLSMERLSELGKLFSANFIELAEGAPDRQRASAKLLRRCAARLIRHAQQTLWRLEWLKLKRLSRVSLLVLPVLLLTVGSLLWSHRDLAKGKPWRTSSVEYQCHPDRSECGGATTNILFHTKLEENPWFQYDLGEQLEFSSLTIRNRADYGPDAALPLVVEASDDGKQYRELARRTEAFLTWRPSFTKARARYVRLRVPKKTYLHLDSVQVHP